MTDPDEKSARSGGRGMPGHLGERGPVRRRRSPAVSPQAALIGAGGLSIQGAVIAIVAWDCLAMVERYHDTLAGTAAWPLSLGELYGFTAAHILFTGSVGLFGVIISFLAAGYWRLRRAWFLRLSLLLAPPYLVVYPVGTLVTAWFLVFLLLKRREFTGDGAPPRP